MNRVPKYIDFNNDFEVGLNKENNYNEVSFTLKDTRRMFLKFDNRVNYNTDRTIDFKKDSIIMFCTGYERVVTENRHHKDDTYYPRNIHILNLGENLSKLVLMKFTFMNINHRILEDIKDYKSYYYNYFQDRNFKKILLTKKDIELDFKINGCQNLISGNKITDRSKLVYALLDQI